MRFLLITIFMLSLNACGDEQCNPDDYNGVYIVKTKKLSGTCNDLGTLVVNADNGSNAQSEGCYTTYDHWTAECKNEADVTCIDLINQTKMRMVGAAELKDNGDILEGILTVTLSNLANQIICTGTYEVIYTRK
jgi:hypothetical protein